MTSRSESYDSRRYRESKPFVILLSLLFIFASTVPVRPLPARQPDDQPSADVPDSRDMDPGKDLFQQAYNMEKQDPLQAAKLYEGALRKGLGPKLRPAALWRLFYLYRDQGDYGNAMLVSRRLGSPGNLKSILDTMRDDLKSKWNIGDDALDAYLEGVTALASGGPNAPPESFLNPFQTALRDSSSGSRAFHLDIIQRINEAGRGNDALRLVESMDQTQPRNQLLRADLLVSLGRQGEALPLLHELSKNGDFLEGDEKFRVLYLLGRIHRDAGDLPGAVSDFRLAASYAKGHEAHRQMALASYALYRNGYALQAMALLRGIPDPEDENIQLLSLILRAEVDADPQAIRALLDRKAQILEAVKNRNPSFLMKRALRIISRYR